VSFFNSEIVRAEMTEITILQEDIYKNIFKFATMTWDEKRFHVGLLEKLLDKQRILYTRLSLSDDPEAIQFKEKIQKQAVMMGMQENIDISVIFNNMESMIKVMKDVLN
jgi:hypothetical protein